MHEVLINHLGGISLPRKSVVRLTDRPDMTLDVYGGRKKNKSTTISYRQRCAVISTSCARCVNFTLLSKNSLAMRSGLLARPQKKVRTYLRTAHAKADL